jgi:hypothetical protein
MSQKMESKIFLELGQVIQIIAPTNLVIHENIYLIEYLDDKLIKLINDKDFSQTTLTIKQKKITDESITQIIILANPQQKGYARQNDLIPDNWITIQFGGNVPTFINGQITDLEEDSIEVTLYQSDKKIYIDFEYKGIPSHLPILNIKPFLPPEDKLDPTLSESGVLQSTPEEKDYQEDSDDDLELIIDNESIQKNTEDLFIDIDDIEVGDEALGEITEMKQVDEKNRRFGIETQTQDILDELLAEYPSNQRTPTVLNNIHIIIERFKQLRRKFSHFDEVGNAENIKKKGNEFKPLVQSLKKLNKQLYWMIPVAKNSHKLFNANKSEDDYYQDAHFTDFKLEMQEIMEFFQHYNTNNVPDSQNKYNYLFHNLNTYFTPFLQNTNTTNIITQQTVSTNLDTIINNFDNFLSTMVKYADISDESPSTIIDEQFVINKYNTGLTRLHNSDIKNKNSKNNTIPLTNNDTVQLLGFMSLPYPFIRYSHINLPNTSIYKKTNLHNFNYSISKILDTNKNINNITIQEGVEPSKDKKLPSDFYDNINYYNFEERRNYIDRNTPEQKEQVLTSFLNNVVPNNELLFQSFKKYFKNTTSYDKLIEQLEPLLVYNDDITFKQYNQISQFMDDEIIKCKKNIINTNKNYIEFLRENKTYFISTILPKLIKKEYLEFFSKQHYNINDNFSTQLSLQRINNYDSGRLYHILLSISQLSYGQSLSVEEKIAEELSKTEEIISNDNQSPQKNCAQYKLVKKYLDIEDIQKDNNSPAFVDSKYDDTPYDIGNDWLLKHSDKYDNPEDIKFALKTFLMENNGVNEDKASVDAEAMIDKVRLVQDNEYAILDIGNGDIKYYVRKNNMWIYDKSLSGKHIDEINFCNLKQNCIKIKETCTNLDNSKELMKKNILEDIVKRFDDELQINFQELKGKLLQDLTYRAQNLTSLKQLKIQKLLKRDILQNSIAKTLEDREIVISPYSNLRDEIIAQTDIIKKFNDLTIFINQFCRIADDDEDNTWFYCIDSNSKLLPTFFQSLAIGFQNKTYKKTVEQICKIRGTLSDDGDKWVDKHSGYYISNIEFDTSEGYDSNGYKIQSRQIMEETIADKLKASSFKDTQFEYSNKTSQLLEKIIKSFDEKLFIFTQKEHNFIIKMTIESINKNVPDEKTYKSLYAKKSKQGKKLKTYERKYDEILLYSLISAYIVSVQTAIPSVDSKKAYGNCKKSFRGFPLDGNNDFSFLQYFSCMLFNLRREDRPWNIIPKALSGKKGRRKTYPEILEKFVTKIKTFMDQYILPVGQIKNKITLKREWDKKFKDITHIPSQFDVQQWDQFLPPLKPIIVNKVNNISPQFESMLKSRIREGSSEQFAHLWSLYGKITSYSFSIIQSIQRVINNEPMLLQTKSGIPFLENACCHDTEPNTNLFFSQKDKTIQTHNNIIYKLATLYQKYKNSNKPPLFNINKNTKNTYPPISKQFSKSTIYLAFIKFCKFNSGIQIDDNLKSICVSNKSNFSKFDSLHDKIAIMENDGLNYNNESLKILLNTINKNNTLKYDLDPPITTEKLHLEETLQYLSSKKDSVICNKHILTHLKNIVDRFDVSLSDENDVIVKELVSVLDSNNNKMIDNIVSNLKLTTIEQDTIFKYSSMDDSQAKINNKREKFILNWKERGDELYISKNDETSFTIFDTIKKIVTYNLRIYPNIIKNQVNFSERYIPKHWLKGSKQFSDKHAKDITSFMLKDGKGFSQFYDDDNIKIILDYVTTNSEDLLMLMNAIPFYSGFDSSSSKKYSSIFDGEILKKLAYYFLLCSFNIYLSAFDIDMELFDTSLEEKRDSIISEDQKLKNKVYRLLSLYVSKIVEYKKLLNINANDINQNVLKTKTKEKEKMVKRLGELTIEEREIEDLMKNYSLGDWGIGKTRAIYEYDSNQYDKERQEMEQDALLEMKSGGLDDVSEFNRELYNISDVIDTVENDDIARRIEAEVFNLSHLAEDDDFGDRDGDF